MLEPVVIDVPKKNPRPSPSRADEPLERKPMVVQVRGSAAFKAWAEKLARFDNRPLSGLVDKAMRRYAKEIGFPDEPPDR
jgi:hypothetical protein